MTRKTTSYYLFASILCFAILASYQAHAGVADTLGGVRKDNESFISKGKNFFVFMEQVARDKAKCVDAKKEYQSLALALKEHDDVCKRYREYGYLTSLYGLVGMRFQSISTPGNEYNMTWEQKDQCHDLTWAERDKAWAKQDEYSELARRTYTRCYPEYSDIRDPVIVSSLFREAQDAYCSACADPICKAPDFKKGEGIDKNRDNTGLPEPVSPQIQGIDRNDECRGAFKKFNSAMRARDLKDDVCSKIEDAKMDYDEFRVVVETLRPIAESAPEPCRTFLNDRIERGFERFMNEFKIPYDRLNARCNNPEFTQDDAWADFIKAGFEVCQACEGEWPGRETLYDPNNPHDSMDAYRYECSSYNYWREYSIGNRFGW